MREAEKETKLKSFFDQTFFSFFKAFWSFQVPSKTRTKVTELTWELDRDFMKHRPWARDARIGNIDLSSLTAAKQQTGGVGMQTTGGGVGMQTTGGGFVNTPIHLPSAAAAVVEVLVAKALPTAYKAPPESVMYENGPPIVLYKAPPKIHGIGVPMIYMPAGPPPKCEFKAAPAALVEQWRIASIPKTPIAKSPPREFNMPAPDCHFHAPLPHEEDEVIDMFCAQAASSQEIAASAELEDGELVEEEEEEPVRAAGADKNKINPWWGLQ
jgi:hypothetical protein